MSLLLLLKHHLTDAYRLQVRAAGSKRGDDGWSAEFKGQCAGGWREVEHAEVFVQFWEAP